MFQAKCQGIKKIKKKLDKGISESYTNINNGGLFMKISADFYQSELECHCGCGYSYLRGDILYKLQLARTMADFPFNVSSWCRCPTHNKDVGGSDTSSHLDGWAIDIDEDDLKQRIRMMYFLVRAGFARVGVGIKQNLVHVDDDPSKPSAIWFY